MQKYSLNIRGTFLTPVLGTLSGNKELATEFQTAKAEASANKATTAAEKIAEENAALVDAQEEIQKASTFFPIEDGRRFLWDYQLKGFLKEAVKVLVELGDAGALTKWTYKSIVDCMVFVNPRKMFYELPTGGEVSFIERPLRAETPQGDRVCVARSEQIPAGTTFEAEIYLLLSSNAKSKAKSLTPELLKEALDYGKLKGLGQWRNASYGQFAYEVLSEQTV